MRGYLYKDLYALEDLHWWHKTKRKLVIFFLKKHLSGKNNLLLDVGCGTGKNLEAFSGMGSVYGIDSSSEAISFCKKRRLKNIFKATAKEMPFQKESFDAVTALDVLEHTEDSKALNEIHRVLKKKGILIATVPAFSWLWSKWDVVLHHKRRYTNQSLREVLEKNGFCVIKISYAYSFLLLPVLIIRKIKEIISKDNYPSDFKLSNKILNHLLTTLANIEKIFIINFRIPFGTSLIAVAEKLIHEKK